MNRDCENQNRNGDCLTRNARSLCDYCDSLLSDDERESREVTFIVADYASKAQRQLAKLQEAPKKCLTLRRNEKRSCIKRGLVALCGFCVSSMTEQKLIAYARTIAAANREHREYLDDRAESDEYTEELKASGAIGIDWNIECSFDNDADYTSRTATLFFLFAFGKPCWDHSRKGWIKQESITRQRKIEQAA